MQASLTSLMVGSFLFELSMEELGAVKLIPLATH